MFVFLSYSCLQFLVAHRTELFPKWPDWVSYSLEKMGHVVRVPTPQLLKPYICRPDGVFRKKRAVRNPFEVLPYKDWCVMVQKTSIAFLVCP